MEQRPFTTLVVDDEPEVRDSLSVFLGLHGYRAIKAADGREALEVFRRELPELIVTDIHMPNMNGLELLRAVKKESPDTCVVILTGYGTEETAINAIRYGASNYLKKPINHHDFIYAIGVLADFIEQRKQTGFDSRQIVREQRTIAFGSDLKRVSGIVFELTKTVASFVSDVDSIRIGLLEIITNAIEHGNLNITYDEKHQAIRQNTLAELYAQRAQELPYRDRKVMIFYDFTPERVIYTIRDDGSGFEWKEILAGGQGLMDLNGRGIYITRLYMDEVVYNTAGNEVTLVKNLE